MECRIGHQLHRRRHIRLKWQPVGSPFVLGIEGEAGYMKLEAGFRSTPEFNASGFNSRCFRKRQDRRLVRYDYGLGYAWDRTLFYVKGGAAFVQVRGSVVDNCQTVASGCGNWVVATRDTTDTITTWTIGGGVEWAVFNNWSIKAEYMFIGLGDSSSLNTCGFAAAPGPPLVGGGQFCFNHEFAGIHTAKLGLNAPAYPAHRRTPLSLREALGAEREDARITRSYRCEIGL